MHSIHGAQFGGLPFNLPNLFWIRIFTHFGTVNGLNASSTARGEPGQECPKSALSQPPNFDRFFVSTTRGMISCELNLAPASLTRQDVAKKSGGENCGQLFDNGPNYRERNRPLRLQIAIIRQQAEGPCVRQRKSHA